MKEIFTKRQAVALLHQTSLGITDVSLKFQVEPTHPLFKLSNEQLYAKLCNIIEESSIAGVVDEI